MTVDVDRLFAAVDAANADDPVGKELPHAERAVEWVRLLRPDAPPELLVAARAHHIRRWEIPRSSEPDGRPGYLRWKKRLHDHHAAVAGRVLEAEGCDPAFIARVQAIVRKERLKSDADVQTLEDALSLVFLETQFDELADKLDEDHMVDVVAKTLRKMTDAGRQAALAVPLDDRATRIVERALTVL